MRGSTRTDANWCCSGRLGQPFGRVRFSSAAIRVHYIFFGLIRVFEFWTFVRSLRHFLLIIFFFIELWIVRLDSGLITEVPLYTNPRLYVCVCVCIYPPTLHDQEATQRHSLSRVQQVQIQSFLSPGLVAKPKLMSSL